MRMRTIKRMIGPDLPEEIYKLVFTKMKGIPDTLVKNSETREHLLFMETLREFHYDKVAEREKHDRDVT